MSSPTRPTLFDFDAVLTVAWCGVFLVNTLLYTAWGVSFNPSQRVRIASKKPFWAFTILLYLLVLAPSPLGQLAHSLGVYEDAVNSELVPFEPICPDASSVTLGLELGRSPSFLPVKPICHSTVSAPLQPASHEAAVCDSTAVTATGSDGIFVDNSTPKCHSALLSDFLDTFLAWWKAVPASGLLHATDHVVHHLSMSSFVSDQPPVLAQQWTSAGSDVTLSGTAYQFSLGASHNEAHVITKQAVHLLPSFIVVSHMDAGLRHHMVVFYSGQLFAFEVHDL